MKITESKERKSIHTELTCLAQQVQGEAATPHPPASLATARLVNFRMRTIQGRILEILGAKLNGKKTSGKKFLSWV